MSEQERLEERLRAFGAAPDEGSDWDDVRRRAEGRFRARPSRKLTLVLAAAIVAAASLTGVFGTRGTRSDATGCSSGLIWSCPGPSGPNGGTSGPTGVAGPTGGPTLVHPLAGGHQVSLSDAESTLGWPIVLPNTSEVSASDLGAVWVLLAPPVGPTAGEGASAAAVTFPSHGL